MTCPLHPQSIVWNHPDGARCGICGYFFDGREPRPAEAPVVRTFAHYRELASRTDGDFGLEYYAGCLCEEAGEFFGLVKKVVYHGHPLDEAKLIKMREELGDALWDLDRAAKKIDATLDQIAAENDAKLRLRYPDGFSKAASINRQEMQGKNKPHKFRCSMCGEFVFAINPRIGDSIYCCYCEECFCYTQAEVPS